jgi:excisionase family DNA binding protein
MDPHTVERPLSPMLTAAEASTILRVRVPQVYALARDGILPAVRVGRAVRFNREQLERWIENGGATARTAGPEA